MHCLRQRKPLFLEYNTSFEDGPAELNGWMNATLGVQFNWTIGTGNTPSGNTGPSAAAEGEFV